jgi:hypothetical protein
MMDEQIERILLEANAYGVRNDVVTMAEIMIAATKKAGVFNDLTKEQIYQQALNTCIESPEYFEYYIKNFKQ